MPEDGVIGPNAVLQLVPVLDRAGGRELRWRVLAGAGIFELPDGQTMIPEGSAARLHQEMRRVLPDLAPALAHAAGYATADYILAHRIPRLAQAVLRVLPAPLAARALARAITAHAWTFAGSGAFSQISPYCFEIRDNPIVRGEHSDTGLCIWHAAVFERLYRVLVAPDFRCTETACCAAGAPACRFELSRECDYSAASTRRPGLE